MNYVISYCCINVMGRVRENNEDNFYVRGRYRLPDETHNDILTAGEFPADGRELIAVYDGMGGEACGEVASLLAASHTAPLPKRQTDAGQALMQLCRTLNHRICQYAQEHGVCCMGTTAAIALFEKKRLVVCNLGDSRIYLARGGTLQQLSIDHVAQSAGPKAPLTQYLGLPEHEYLLEPYCASLPYQDGDSVLLCSDGLTDMVSEKDIAAVLRSGTDVERRARQLGSMAMKNGGVDNITVILCRIHKRRDIFWKKK